MKRLLTTTTALALSLAANATFADTIKIGVLATLEGPFTVLGETVCAAWILLWRAPVALLPATILN